MSSIASLYVLREPDVRTLAESGHAPDDLELRDAFHWSGYFMLYLLLFLEEEQDVPVSRSRYDEVLPDPADGMRFVLTAEHQAHLPRLDVATFDQAAFDDYLDEMGARSRSPHRGRGDADPAARSGRGAARRSGAGHRDRLKASAGDEVDHDEDGDRDAEDRAEAER
ncbi:hypothetical protein [Dactylosporangium cerinum]